VVHGLAVCAMGEAGAKDSLSIADMSDQASVTFCGEFGVRQSCIASRDWLSARSDLLILPSFSSSCSPKTLHPILRACPRKSWCSCFP
jgi:hypothetical protein